MSKPTVPEVIDRFRSYVSKPGNGGGGSLHIVLSDENVDNGSVAFCVKWAEEQGDEDGAALARVLLSMSPTQRRKIAYRCWETVPAEAAATTGSE